MPDSGKEKSELRIARYLAMAGIASRRKSEQLIENGRVTVNGRQIISPALNIDQDHDVITVDGQVVKPQEYKYYALNKPPGYLCSASDKHAQKLVTELFPSDSPRLFTVGRLDKDSEGLILCTNDGKFANRVAHPSNHIPKVYCVTVNGEITAEKMSMLKDGITDQGEFLKATDVKDLTSSGHSNNQPAIEITVTEGRKREIRRMCKACNWEVVRLIRTRIGPVSLGNLPHAATRELTEDERNQLMKS